MSPGVKSYLLVALTIPAALACDRARAADTPPPIRSAKSGPWSAPRPGKAAWSPAAGTKVQVRLGHTIVYDANTSEAIRSIHVAGTLTFAADRDTRLNVGLIKIQGRRRHKRRRLRLRCPCEGTRGGDSPPRPGSGHPQSTHRRRAHGHHPPRLFRRHGQGVVPGRCLLRRADGFSRRRDEPHLGPSSLPPRKLAPPR